MTRLVFMDTETFGLAPDARVWDFAAIIRDPGEADREVQFFISHNPVLAKYLPESFRADYDARYNPEEALDEFDAAMNIRRITDGAHIVGCVPDFDTMRLGNMLRAAGTYPRWHYHLIDVENLAVGWLRGAKGVSVSRPWSSEALSRMVGVEPEQFERHTALGDARWARAIYDALDIDAPTTVAGPLLGRSQPDQPAATT